MCILEGENILEQNGQGSIEYVHGTVDRVHQSRLTGLQTSLNVGRWLPDR
jgi:hypothetical protein